MTLSKLMFLSTNALSIILIFSSSAWFLLWMSLEINMLSFIALMYKKSTLSAESLIKYFIIQSFASYMYLMFILNPTPFLIMISMLIKLGASPFHIWFPQISESLSWPTIFLFLTTQKIPPLFILSLMFSPLLMMFIPLSLIMGSLGGLGQTSMRKILFFSSISHLGWIMTAIFMKSSLWILYLMIYTIILSTILLNLKPSSAHIHQLSGLSFYNKISLMISFLSLGGMPPFLGFLPKILLINLLISLNMTPIVTIMILSSLINLFFYCRTILPPIFMYSANPTSFNLKIFSISSIINIFILPPMFFLI